MLWHRLEPLYYLGNIRGIHQQAGPLYDRFDLDFVVGLLRGGFSSAGWSAEYTQRDETCGS